MAVSPSGFPQSTHQVSHHQANSSMQVNPTHSPSGFPIAPSNPNASMTSGPSKHFPMGGGIPSHNPHPSHFKEFKGTGHEQSFEGRGGVPQGGVNWKKGS